MKQKTFFNENIYDALYPSRSVLLLPIYGTPKIHKFPSSDSISKLCLIASSIGTPNYNFERYLCYLMSPLIPSQYFYKDAFSFVSQIKNQNLISKFRVSYDVMGPFINIPLQGTIQI